MPKSKKSDSEKASKIKESKASKGEKPAKEKKGKKEAKIAEAKPEAPPKAEKKAPKPPKQKSAPAPAPIAISADDISLRAYFIAERRQAMGWPGDSTSDWVEAERQLKAEAARKTKR